MPLTLPRLALASPVAAPSSFQPHGVLIEWPQAGRAYAEMLALPLAYAAIGFSPIGALALHIAGILPLGAGALLFVGMAVLAAVALGYHFPAWSRLALEGFAAGLLAVFAYDAARWITISFGWWGDFIPSIGGWLLGTNEPNAVLGYTYRWLGDGGGMGLAFLVAARSLQLASTRVAALGLGIAFGIAVWACLLATLLGTPSGQELLFRLTPTTFTLSLGGHLIYGAVLGAWLGLRRTTP